MTQKKRLGDLLIEARLITQDNLEKALRLQVDGNRRLGYLLIKMGFISESELHGILSKQLDLPIVDIEEEFNQQVKTILPRYLCQKYSAIPLNLGDNNTLTTAMVDPSDSEAVSDIENYTGKVIRPVLASKSNISKGIKSLLPWSFKEFLNPQISRKLTATVAIIALLLVVVTATQFYQNSIEEKYGKITKTPQSISYENLELIVGFDDKNKVSLLGRGAHAQGYYSVTFNDRETLSAFIDSKKNDFSARQIEWLAWAITNPKQK